MPTTAYVEFTAAVRGIQDRSDAAGADVTDLSGEEDRLIHAILTEGALTDAAFLVQASGPASMTVKVGSGTAKADIYAVAGEIAGQGTYLARLDATTVDVTASAADPAQARTDEVYLVILDDPYDSSARSLPKIGYRRGDAGGGNPGPDTAWKASALLARLAVGAAASSITTANITDTRTFAHAPTAFPAGAMLEWPVASPPTGWILCDGGELNRTTFRRLFSVIGTTYGVGNGTTTFNVPDRRGRFPVGYKAGDADFGTLGGTGGAKTDDATTGGPSATFVADTVGAIQNTASEVHTHDVTVDILPPHMAVNWIIRA